MLQRIEEFEVQMQEFVDDLQTGQRLEENCRYFANLFADLLRENYKLKDQIIDMIRQVEVYREELYKCSYDSYKGESRKFKKDMASVETLLTFIVEDRELLLSDQRNIEAQLDKSKEQSESLRLSLIAAEQNRIKSLEESNLEWSQRLQAQKDASAQCFIDNASLEKQNAMLNEVIAKQEHQNSELKKQISVLDVKLKNSKTAEALLQQKLVDQEAKNMAHLADVNKKYQEDKRALRTQSINQQQQLQSSYEEKLSILNGQFQAQSETLKQITKQLQEAENNLQDISVQYQNHKLESNNIQEQLQSDINSKISQVKLLLSQKQKCEDEISSKSYEISILKEEKSNLNEGLATCNLQLQQEKEKYSRMDTAYKDKIASLRDKIQKILTDKDIQEKELKMRFDQVLQNKINQMETEYNARSEIFDKQKNQEANQLKILLEKAKEEMENIKLNCKEKEQIIQLETIQKIQSIEAQVGNYKSQLRGNNLTIQELKTELQQEQQKNKDLIQQAVQEKRIALEELQNKLQQYEKNNEQILQQARQQMNKQLGVMQEALQMEQIKFDKLQTEYNQAKQQFTQLELNYIQQIETQRDEVNRCQRTFSYQINQLEIKQKQLLDIIKQISSKYQQLGILLKEKDDSSIYCTAQVNNLKQKLIDEQIQYKASLKTCQEQLGLSEQKIQEMTFSLYESRTQSDHWKEQLMQLREQAQQDIERFNREVQKLVTQSQTYRDEHNRTIERHKLEIKQFEIKIDDLNNQLRQKDEVLIQRIQALKTAHELQKQTEKVDPEIFAKQKHELMMQFADREQEIVQKFEAQIKAIQDQFDQEFNKPQEPSFSYKDALMQEKMEHDELKEQYEAYRIEKDNYLVQLNQKYQTIIDENNAQMKNLQDDKLNLRQQIESLRKLIDDLNARMIQQESKYRTEIEQLKELNSQQLQTISEQYQGEEELRQQYEDNLRKFDFFKRKQQSDRTATESEIISKLLKDQKELIEQVGQANERAREAADIIKYLDLELQNYKKSSDMFGKGSATQISTAKMLNRVTQIKQDIEQAQYKLKQKTDEQDFIHSVPSEQDYKKKKTNNSMIGSVRDPISCQSRIDNEIQFIDLPTSFNAFVDDRQHVQVVPKQNRYNDYIEQKKKKLEADPKKLNPIKLRNRTPDQNKQRFLPYYLRNPDTNRPKTLKRRNPSFNVSGNSIVL